MLLRDQAEENDKPSTASVKTGMREDKEGFSMSMAEDEYLTELTGHSEYE